jgi:predicted permease
MIVFLRCCFTFVLISMASVTTWASMKLSLWDTPREVILHPWFIATLFDTCFAFLTFWAWVAYKETSWLARVAWLLGILIFGNFVIASYMLIQLFRVPASASLEQILLRRPNNK